jgi:ABC-type lipoprotein export system ATPase subunit
MDIAKLENYRLAPDKSGNGITDASLTILENDIISIIADDRDDAALLLKGLATLSYPTDGSYKFNNEILDFSDYRNLLSAKKNIGYIGSEATMLTNRTIRQNMMLSAHFFHNSQSLDIDRETMELCELLKIKELLDKRPFEITKFHSNIAISLRAIMKRPKLLIIENPEEYLGYEFMDQFTEKISEFLKDSAVIFFSASKYVRDTLTKSEISIKDGKLFQDLN